MELTIKIQITVDKQGNIVVGDVTHDIDVHVVTKTDFFLSESQKMYNYVAIGKFSALQLPMGENVKVVYEDIIVLTHTHRSQRNRIDGLKKILDKFEAGNQINVSWDAAKKELIFEKVMAL
jgi:antitoxin component of MazEF toxin-antitoxin module